MAALPPNHKKVEIMTTRKDITTAYQNMMRCAKAEKECAATQKEIAHKETLQAYETYIDLKTHCWNN
jgi:hypothetical protein